jgi:hypothetical protein
MKKVINIAHFKKIIMKDLEKNIHFVNKKGVILIEFEDFSRIIIDLSTQKDITDNKNYEIFIKKGLTKCKYLLESD